MGKTVNDSMSKLTLQRTINGQDLVFIAAGRHECPASHSCGPAARAYEMIHFVIKGKVHYYFYGQHYLVKAGQCFYAPAFANTFYHSDLVDPCTYAWINFTGNDAKDIIRNCGLSNLSPVAPVKDIDSIWTLINELLLCNKPTRGNDLAIQGFMRVILAMLMTHTTVRDDSVEESLVDNELVERAVAYVQQHADEQLSVQKLAEALFISRGYLHQLFSKYLRITPQQFITNYKTQTASELLIKTSMPISQIADQCGYANQAAFSRAFARELSMSPSEYRQRFTRPSNLITE